MFYLARIVCKFDKKYSLVVQNDSEYDAHKRIRMICRTIRDVVQLNIEQVEQADERDIGILREL